MTTLYRLSYVVPLAYVRQARARARPGLGQRTLLADVGFRAERAGAGSAELVTQDPTDETRFAVIATRSPAKADDVAVLAGVEPVTAPAAEDASHPDARYWLARLDPGLLPSEARAVGRALDAEQNPRHLAGFASSFEPHFPVAASLLRQKASRIQPDSRPQPFATAISGLEATALRAAIARRGSSAGLPPDIAFGEVRRALSGLLARDDVGAIPAEARALAGACVVRWPDGTETVDRNRLAWASPPTGDEGYVSPGALQFVIGADRPASARVARHGEIERVLSAFEETPGDPRARLDQLRAKLAIEKAHKAIERARWAAWYAKNV